MNLEELKQIIFLSEHGYYDLEAIKMANANKPDNVESYELHGDSVITVHSGGIRGYYGVDNERVGREILAIARKRYIITTFPEIKKLVDKKEKKNEK